MVCLNCGANIPSKKKYCSNKCQADYQYKSYITKWKAGLETGQRGKYETSDYIRRYLVEKFHNKCAQCKWGEINPYTGNVPLEIDHIDGDHTNNKEKNVTLLCPNCHSLTKTFKGANKGNGRKARKQYSLYNTLL